MPRLFTVDTNGEYWLDNPQLVIANKPRRRKRGQKSMAARRRRRTTRRRASVARRNYYGAGMVANPPRRRKRSYRMNRRKRSYRRNMHPPFYAANKRGRRRYRRNPNGIMRRGRLFGFSVPPLDAVLWTGAGLIVPPILTPMVMAALPSTWRTTPVQWVVRVASVIVPPMIVGQFVGRREGNLMLIGSGASFVLDLIREFAPGVIPGLSGQPLLGSYFARPTNQGVMPYRRPASGLPPIIAAVPERLSPSARF